MAIGDRVRERRETLGMTQPQLAKAVRDRGGSLSQGQVSSLEAGGVTNPRSIVQLAAALRTTVEWLVGGEKSAAPPAAVPADTPDIHRANGQPIVTSPLPLVVWRSVPSPGRSGEMLIYKEQAGVATRPVELAGVKDAFAVKAVDDDGAPRYENRCTLLIDPSIAPAEGDDCLFVRDPAAIPWVTVTRKLVKITPDHWVVRRWEAGARDQKLARSEWPAAWHIFGSYNRR